MTHKICTKRKISITILPSIDELLDWVSSEYGESKSSLIEKAVSQFFAKKLDKDTKALAKLKFEDLPSEDEWLTLQSEADILFEKK